ncbi:hypothetical protein [Streptomyces sp. x-80]|uniref:hypothetical protein n=1 Tax=Streptomyces sp. x-80 TaxID=2789282 RepID=UPI003980E660
MNSSFFADAARSKISYASRVRAEGAGGVAVDDRQRLRQQVLRQVEGVETDGRGEP